MCILPHYSNIINDIYYLRVSDSLLLNIDRVNLESYDKLAFEYDSLSHVTTRLLEIASKDGFDQFLNIYRNNLTDTVLEVGTGTGFLTSELVKVFNVTSIDISNKMLLIADSKINSSTIRPNKVIFKNISILSPPINFLCNKFNLITCGLADPYFIRKSILNIFKLLSDDGILFFTLPEVKWAKKERILRLKVPFHTTRFKLENGESINPFSFVYTEDEIYKLLNECNFRLLHVFTILANYHDLLKSKTLFKNIPKIICVIAQKK